MSHNYWLIILFVASVVCNGNCRPLEVDISNIHPVYRAVKQLKLETPNSTINPFFSKVSSSRPVTENSDVKDIPKSSFNIESIATVARASSDGPPGPSPAAFGQFVDAVGQMVESDIRTPPKLKEILKEKNSDRRDTIGESLKSMPVTFVYEDDRTPEKLSQLSMTEKVLFTDASEGKASNTNKNVPINDEIKGIAIPVVMDDDSIERTEPPKFLQKIPEVAKPVKDEKKKNAMTKLQSTTTPSSGLSTWILLSDNREVTTLSPKKNNKKENTDDKKKITSGNPTTKKPTKVQGTTTKTISAVKKVTTKSTSNGNKKTDLDTSSTSALEALVKTQKKGGITMTTVTTTTPKTKTNDLKTSSQKKTQSDPKKRVSDKKDIVGKTKNETAMPEYKTANTIPGHFIIATEGVTTVSTTEQNGLSTVTENSVEGTTKKKKLSTKKKKKNKKKKKVETKVEAKIPPQAVSSQIYNFLSREIVPTVGLGLIGVALTAGLASFLGYNPFVSSAVPLRRTYESNHGYSPNNYYTYNSDYSDGGQPEESLLREVLSGMPEESRYGLTRGDSSYSEMYKRKDGGYDSVKNPVYSKSSGNIYETDKEEGNYDSNYNQDYSYPSTYDTTDSKFTAEFNEKFPVYTRETGTSFVYPETTGMTSAEKIKMFEQGTQMNKSVQYGKTASDTIEKQPEALYRVASDPDPYINGDNSGVQVASNQNNWHRIGTPMESVKYSRLEPGPRSLDLTKESEPKNRTKRDVGGNIQRIARKRSKKENDAENEIDFEDSFNTNKSFEQNFEETSTKMYTSSSETPIELKDTLSTDVNKNIMSTTTEYQTAEDDSTEPYIIDDGGTGPVSSTNAVLDVLKRLAQFKLKLGLNFLRSTTDMFSKYLDVIQKKVDETFKNTTTVQYNRQKNPWSRIFFSDREETPSRIKRSALKETPLLATLLTEEEKVNDRFSKSTKKDLRLSNKIFHYKKTNPKKYHSKNKY